MSDKKKPNDLLGTPEAREEAERKVLYPDTDTMSFEFLGASLKLRALPIFYARKLSTVLRPFQEQFAATAKAASENQVLSQIDLDESTITALLDTAGIICEYYKAPLTRDDIERGASTTLLVALAKAQLEVNGKSDFLLTPLRLITRLTGLVEEATDQLERAVVTDQPPSS